MSAVKDKRRVAVVAALGAAALLTAVDVVADTYAGAGLAHVLIEVAVTLVALAVFAWEATTLWYEARAAEAEASELAERLVETRRDASRWAKDATALLQGLAGAIDAQLERWELSGAEKETALLLLKGLSHKEIGDVRGVGEATARQQARALYRKAGLSGRHDLAAYFLEDLLVPPAASLATLGHGAARGALGGTTVPTDEDGAAAPATGDETRVVEVG